jgi:hypothetical protein
MTETPYPVDTIDAEWTNVTADQREYPGASGHFAGAWESDPEGDYIPRLAVRVWQGIEQKGGHYHIESRKHDSDDLPYNPKYVIETLLEQNLVRETFATTREEAIEQGKQEKQWLQHTPSTTISDTARITVKDAISSVGPNVRTIKHSGFDISGGIGGPYELTHHTLVEIDGWLQLDGVMDGQGLLETNPEVRLTGFRDSFLTVDVTVEKQPEPPINSDDHTKVVVEFVPQEWIESNGEKVATVVSREPPRFTVPIEAATDDDGDLLQTDTKRSDQLRNHDHAPDWVNEWAGPFYVKIDEVRNDPDGEIGQ